MKWHVYLRALHDRALHHVLYVLVMLAYLHAFISLFISFTCILITAKIKDLQLKNGCRYMQIYAH